MTRDEEILFEMLCFDASSISLNEFQEILEEICSRKSFLLEKVQFKSLPVPDNTVYMYTMTNSTPKLNGKPNYFVVFELEYLFSQDFGNKNRIILTLSQSTIAEINKAKAPKKEKLMKMATSCFNSICSKFRVV